jgi:hypothetical protein
MKKKVFLFLVSFYFFKGFSQPLDTVKASVYYSFAHARDTMFLDKYNTEIFLSALFTRGGFSFFKLKIVVKTLQ